MKIDLMIKLVVKNSSYLIVLLSIAVTMLSGCKGKSKETNVVQPVNVRIVSAGSADSNNARISYNGTVQESRGINVSFQVSGTITQVLVEKGQHISRGQLLATVDETTYRNQYNAQLAQQQQTEDNYNRTNEVFKKGSIAEVRLVEAKSNFEKARSSAKAAYQDIVHCRVYAPTDGYIGDKSVEAGAAASPGTTAFQIVKLQTVKINVPVPESEISKLKKNDPATVKVSALNNQTFSGKIDEISVLASNNSHNYDVKVAVANPGIVLKPGMLTDVYFNKPKSVNHQDSSSVSVPLVAVQADEKGNNFVFVTNADGTKAIRREVKTGALLQGAVKISSGISANDKVIISGYHKITDGSAIHIIQ